MVNLRCAKCGSDENFLVETSQAKRLEIRGKLDQDRIKATVRVTCTYCNCTWDHAPVRLVDTKLQEAFQRRHMAI
jgi:hypothetical protein